MHIHNTVYLIILLILKIGITILLVSGCDVNNDTSLRKYGIIIATAFLCIKVSLSLLTSHATLSETVLYIPRMPLPAVSELCFSP